MNYIETSKLCCDFLLFASLVYMGYRFFKVPATSAITSKIVELETSLRKLITDAEGAGLELNDQLLKRKRELEKLLTDIGGLETRVTKTIQTAEEKRQSIDSQIEKMTIPNTTVPPEPVRTSHRQRAQADSYAADLDRPQQQAPRTQSLRQEEPEFVDSYAFNEPSVDYGVEAMEMPEPPSFDLTSQRPQRQQPQEEPYDNSPEARIGAAMLAAARIEKAREAVRPQTSNNQTQVPRRNLSSQVEKLVETPLPSYPNDSYAEAEPEFSEDYDPRPIEKSISGISSAATRAVRAGQQIQTRPPEHQREDSRVSRNQPFVEAPEYMDPTERISPIVSPTLAKDADPRLGVLSPIKRQTQVV